MSTRFASTSQIRVTAAAISVARRVVPHRVPLAHPTSDQHRGCGHPIGIEVVVWQFVEDHVDVGAWHVIDR